MNNYQITCHDTNRGFFSDLIHGILPSIIYLQDINNESYNVDWTNPLYQSNSFNLFNHFFSCNKNYDEYNFKLNMSNCPYGIYFSLYNTYEQLKRGSDAIKKINLFESRFFKKIIPPFDINSKILGVQQRKTDHGVHVNLTDDELLIKMVEKFYINNNFDYIFLITDDIYTLNKFIEKFGDKLKYNDVFRSNNESAIHFHRDLNFDKIKLAEDVMIDSYCLSLTNYKFICNSNVSTFSILSNFNDNNYEYIDK